MNQLIQITTTEGKQTVNARELHQFLEVKSRFRDWIKNNLEFFEAVEGVDFTVLNSKQPESIGNSRKDYFVTVDIAKELSMVQRTDKGKQARKYFVEIEKQHKQLTALPDFTNPAAAARAWAAEYEEKKALRIENKEQEQKLLEAKPKVEFYDAVTGSKTTIDMKTAAAVLNIKGVGRNKLFEILRKRMVLMSDNTPYRQFIDLGYFRQVETSYSLPDGEKRVSVKTVVYQKGLNFIRKVVERWGRFEDGGEI